jgi:hypothetical protein
MFGAMRTALTALLLLVLTSAGCSFNHSILTLNPSLPMDSYSVHDRRDGSFQVNIAPSRYQALVDSGEPALTAFVRGALVRQNLCPTGYVTDAPVTQWGHVEIVGRCNPPV